MADSKRTPKPLRERAERALQKFAREADESGDAATFIVASKALNQMVVLRAETDLATALRKVEADNGE